MAREIHCKCRVAVMDFKPYITITSSFIFIPVLIRFYPCKQGWPDLPHSASNLSHSHSPSHSILCILLLQTNTLTIFYYIILIYVFISFCVHCSNESSVGEAIKKAGVKREEIFVVTKLLSQDHGYDNCIKAIHDSLKK